MTFAFCAGLIAGIVIGILCCLPWFGYRHARYDQWKWRK